MRKKILGLNTNSYVNVGTKYNLYVNVGAKCKLRKMRNRHHDLLVTGQRHENKTFSKI